jgi:hypothetical protein
VISFFELARKAGLQIEVYCENPVAADATHALILIFNACHLDPDISIHEPQHKIECIIDQPISREPSIWAINEALP